MTYPPQSFMIFREELLKANIEKERLKKEYQAKIDSLKSEMDILKEQLNAQEDMMKRALEYAIGLEEKMSEFQQNIDDNSEHIRSGIY